MDSYNKKLALSAQKLRDSYAFIHANRRRVMFISSVEQNNCSNKVTICKAFNMNGSQCTCKAKSNGLCGRHLKK